MDMQNIINNAIKARRAEEMKTSSQLMLGELILKLEAIKKKELPVVFDDKKYKPTGLDSWRGSYCELAIQYKDGGETCYEQAKQNCERDEFGDHHFRCKCGGSKGHSTSLPKKPTVQDLLNILNLVNGKYFTGYKGGDFTMGKTTPIWVANYGESSGFKEDKEYRSQAVVDVSEDKSAVIIKTELLDY